MKQNRVWKRVSALLMLLCMICACIPEIALAGDGDSNDNYLTADTIYANIPVTGVTSKTDKVDYYKYTVTEPGYFTISYSRAGDKGSWFLSVTDSKNVILQSYSVSSNRESDVFNLGVGECVYIMIKNSSSGDYILTINETPASDWEQEPNDDVSSAITLQNEEWINGNGYKNYDEDWYKYSVQVPGYLYFELQPVDAGTRSWSVEVLDDHQVQLEKDSVASGFQSKKYCGEMGQAFYFHVKNSYNNTRQYKLRVVFVESDEWELESNNTVALATEISANQTIHGVLNSKEDIDMYKFVSPGNGVYQFALSGVDTGTKARWKLSLYDANNKLIQTLNTQTDLESSMVRLNFKKGKVVYLKVEQYNTYARGIEYTVTMNYQKDSTWEQESNDSFTTAVSLKKNKAITGTCYASSDADYYVYKAPAKGTIKFTFSGDQVDVGNGWRLIVYDQNKKEVKIVKYVKDTQTIGVKAKKGKKYYFVVKPENSKMADISYTLKVK